MKDTFHVGDKVWILPFEDVAGRYALEYFGISKRCWEDSCRYNPVTIRVMHVDREDDVDTARMEEVGFYWPLDVLSPFDPSETSEMSSVSVGDLL